MLKSIMPNMPISVRPLQKLIRLNMLKSIMPNMPIFVRRLKSIKPKLIRLNMLKFIMPNMPISVRPLPIFVRPNSMLKSIKPN